MAQSWDLTLGVDAASVSFEQVHAKFRQLMIGENLDGQQVLLLSQALRRSAPCFRRENCGDAGPPCVRPPACLTKKAFLPQIAIGTDEQNRPAGVYRTQPGRWHRRLLRRTSSIPTAI